MQQPDRSVCDRAVEVHDSNSQRATSLTRFSITCVFSILLLKEANEAFEYV
jgi:hypothetical protein